MDLDMNAQPGAAAVLWPAQSAVPSGFSGTAGKLGVTWVAGLTTLTGDTFGAGSTVPMVPGTWDADPAGGAEAEGQPS
jgi:hypothetical protein